MELTGVTWMCVCVCISCLFVYVYTPTCIPGDAIHFDIACCVICLCLQVFGSQGMQVFDVASGQQLYAVSKDSLCERYERCPKGVQPGGSGCAWTNDCKW